MGARPKKSPARSTAKRLAAERREAARVRDRIIDHLIATAPKGFMAKYRRLVTALPVELSEFQLVQEGVTRLQSEAYFGGNPLGPPRKSKRGDACRRMSMRLHEMVKKAIEGDGAAITAMTKVVIAAHSSTGFTIGKHAAVRLSG